MIFIVLACFIYYDISVHLIYAIMRSFKMRQRMTCKMITGVTILFFFRERESTVSIYLAPYRFPRNYFHPQSPLTCTRSFGIPRRTLSYDAQLITNAQHIFWRWQVAKIALFLVAKYFLQSQFFHLVLQLYHIILQCRRYKNYRTVQSESFVSNQIRLLFG